MANYRRWRVEGGTYFFTLVAHSRAPIFVNQVAREILGKKFRECTKKWPFETNTIVLLPEHLHLMMTLPPGDANYVQRLAWIKKEFTKDWLASGGIEQEVSLSRRERDEHGVWQPRYWEHTIRDERDFDRHFDYIHYNPVKHGYVRSPSDWRWSSFHRWVQAGVYEPDWGRGALSFEDVNETAMELT